MIVDKDSIHKAMSEIERALCIKNLKIGFYPNANDKVLIVHSQSFAELNHFKRHKILCTVLDILKANKLIYIDTFFSGAALRIYF